MKKGPLDENLYRQRQGFLSPCVFSSSTKPNPPQKAGKPMNIHSLRMRSNYITSDQFDPAAILGQTNIEKAAHGKKVLFTAPINRLNRKHVVER